MAGLLNDVIVDWSSTSAAPYPCGEDVWIYIHKARGLTAPDLPVHRTRKEMTALLRKHDGLLNYAQSLVESLGMVETDNPVRGDVGVVDIPGMGTTCAIFMGKRWLVRGDKEVLVTEATMLKAWRI